MIFDKLTIVASLEKRSDSKKLFPPDLAPSALKFQLEKTSPLTLLLLGLFVLTSYSQQHPPPHLSFSKYYAERFVPVALERIHKAQATYAATIGNGSYGSLAQFEHAGLIDAGLGSGSKHGYLFSISTTSGGSGTFPNFIITAVPKQYKKPGLRSYAMERFGELHGADKGGEPATIADSYIAA